MRPSVAVALYATAMCLLVGRDTARADGIIINPIRITLPADHRTGFFVVTNGTRDPVLFQTALRSWTQVNGTDRLGTTDDVLAVPVVFNLAPGASQTVRVALQREPDPVKELTYRILATEIPTGATRANTATVVLRFSIPIFAPPPAAAGDSVQWSCVRQHDGKLRVTAANRGDEHAIVTSVGLFIDPKHRELVAAWNPGAYVLAGQSRSWTVDAKLAAGSKAVFVESQSIEGAQTAVAPVTSP